ncbi:hypothetical protein NGA_2061600, partial [Nannochloropsis gaditana CCMP526]|uniref:uncharacterized protein n=1 Tax=Nannochloropsis gaditana (strain CCMP526) TaxID=1093141 RepID=UPI00029F732D
RPSPPLPPDLSTTARARRSWLWARLEAARTQASSSGAPGGSRAPAWEGRLRQTSLLSTPEAKTVSPAALAARASTSASWTQNDCLSAPIAPSQKWTAPSESPLT